MSHRALTRMLAAVTAGMFVASLTAGPAGLSFLTSLTSLLGGENEAARLVMQEIRLPRALLGAMIGGTLGLSGAVLQGYLRNPLADPGVLGISATASLAAVMAIYSGLTAVYELALPAAAILGAVCAVAALHLLAGAMASALTLILAGVAIGSLAAALTSLVLNLSSNPFAALEILFWMLGSLSDRSMVHVWLAAPFMLAGWAMLAFLGRGLDALTLGPEVAASMGIDTVRLQRLMILGTAISVGAATAVAGSIGFIGLVVPHLLRPLIGEQPGRLLLPSALGGASLLLAADVAVRVLAPGQYIKLGVVTAIIGAPFFFWLVVKTRRALP